MPRVSNNVVIVGIGETPVGSLPGMNAVQIQAMAVHEALVDCGQPLQALDGLINLDPYATPESMFSITLTEYLGIRPSFAATVDVGGTVTGMTMLQQAIWAIDAGHCRMAAVVYGANGKTSRPRNMHGNFMRNLQGAEEWEVPFGMQGLVIPYALLAQRYLDEYGASTDDFGAVAVATRKHAMLNEKAMMRKPMSIDDHRGSRMISSPLRLLDCSLVSDGGVALILCSRDRANELGLPAVTIRSMAARVTHNSVAQLPDIAQLGMRDAGQRALADADVSVTDIDVALIHDAYTVSVLITLEALGFCGPGEGGDYIRSGAASLGGDCPVNTHGGLLSFAHIGGMPHFTEAVRQLRGGAGSRQVKDARTALIAGNGGVFSNCGVMIMARG